MTGAKRLAFTMGWALVAAVVWLMAAFMAASSLSALKPLWHLAVAPAIFLRSSVLPLETAAFVFGRESQNAHSGLLLLLMVTAWWIILSCCLRVAWPSAVRRNKRS